MPSLAVLLNILSVVSHAIFYVAVIIVAYGRLNRHRRVSELTIFGFTTLLTLDLGRFAAYRTVPMIAVAIPIISMVACLVGMAFISVAIFVDRPNQQADAVDRG